MISYVINKQRAPEYKVYFPVGELTEPQVAHAGGFRLLSASQDLGWSGVNMATAGNQTFAKHGA